MRLRYVQRVNFGKSEATNFAEFTKKYRVQLKPGEVICFVSLTGTQIVFVFAPLEIRYYDKAKSTTYVTPNVISSERVRCTNSHKWNPLMLADYAKQKGVEIDGLKLFEQHLDRQMHSR